MFLRMYYFVKFRDVRMTQSPMMINLSSQPLCLKSVCRLYNNLKNYSVFSDTRYLCSGHDMVSKVNLPE